ncbi:MAG: hypothetical protein WC222_11220 [Parachlamydiales bacterium]
MFSIKFHSNIYRLIYNLLFVPKEIQSGNDEKTGSFVFQIRRMGMQVMYLFGKDYH